MGLRGTKNTISRALTSLVIFTLIISIAAGCGGTSGGNGQRNGTSTNNFGELLTNSDFLNGMEGWSVINQPGPSAAGINNVEIIPATQSINGVHMTRTCNQNDIGSSGVSQKINKKLSSNNILTVRAMIKVNLESGDSLAGSNPQLPPESAVQVKLIYTDPKGLQKEWCHGFYYSEIAGANKKLFTKVKQGTWTKYLSGDLKPKIGTGSTLNEFQVYGVGWNYDGYASDISIILSK